MPEGTVPVSVEENVHSSTHSSQVLTLQTPDQKTLTVFCKHGAPCDASWLGHCHRGGLSYEADVYRRVLVPLKVTVPAFHGAFHHAARNEHYLLIEHLLDALAVSRCEDPEAMPRAAQWIGALHAQAEHALAATESAFLTEYDRDYYLGWSKRTLGFTRQRGLDAPWLPPLCDRYEGVVALLLSAAQTIIHGEYYPKNVLVHDGVTSPVDWESAAVAAGEIDLASLTQGWSQGVVTRCVQAYCDVRWGREPPKDFLDTLSAAQLYWRFRWLGNSADWSTGEGFRTLLEELRSLAEDNALL